MNPTILLTFDIEDWFQVENFKPYIPFSTWPSCELRVEKNTQRILDLLDQESGQRINDNGQQTRPPRLSPPGTARHERAGESDGGQATDTGPEIKTSFRQRRIGLSRSHPETEKSQKSMQSCESCLTTPKATFFVLGWIAERLPHLVKEIRSRGHEVASHGYQHTLCTDSSPRDLRNDLIESKKRLEDITGAPVYGYRAPSFSINDDILKIIEECGYLYDSSYNSFGMHSRYGTVNLSANGARGIAIPVNQKSAIENRQFYELPISNLNFKKPFSYKLSAISSEQSKASFVLPWGGGAYFRFMPYPVFRWGVQAILKKQNGYVFYMHPWEIDPDQPTVDQASLFFKFRHYTNLGKTASKLSSFIKAFKDCSFITCSQYLQLKMP